jgi:hypothetical protein
MTGGEQQTLGLSPLLLAQAAGGVARQVLDGLALLVIPRTLRPYARWSTKGAALVKPRNVRHLVS